MFKNLSTPAKLALGVAVFGVLITILGFIHLGLALSGFFTGVLSALAYAVAKENNL